MCSSDEYVITCDDFVTFKFYKGTDYFLTIDKASSIRRSFAVVMKKRLEGEGVGDLGLAKSIISFLRSDVEFMLVFIRPFFVHINKKAFIICLFSMTRKACPNLDVEIGFFLPSGEKLDESEDSEESTVQSFLMSGEVNSSEVR